MSEFGEGVIVRLKSGGPDMTCTGELNRSGNGYVFGKYLSEYSKDKRGWVNIKGFTEKQLRAVIKQSIDSLR